MSPNLPPLHGDRQRLTQVFLNLILNALDAMPQGGWLDISAQNSKEKNFIEVHVTDTGVGIPEHIIKIHPLPSPPIEYPEYPSLIFCSHRTEKPIKRERY